MMHYLTRSEAYDLIDEAEADDALAQLATNWDMPGWWNDSAEWDATTFYAFVDESALTDDVRAYGPRFDDVTGIEA